MVSNDLNAAKPAMQIQATEKPKFDNIFIIPGAFHTEMAFFKALGKLVEDSGGENMLTETEVLATGSLNGFITGKHFNRRKKRLYLTLALAFEVLRFSAFIEEFSDNQQQIETIVNNLKSNSEEEVGLVVSSDEFKAVVDAYEKYTENTR